MASARASSPRSSANIPPGPSPGCRGPASWISANPSRSRRVHTGSTFGNSSSSTGSIDSAFGGSPTRSGSGFPQPRSPSAVGLARSVTSPSSGRAFFALIFVAVALVMVYMAALPTVNSGGWAADGAARAAVRPGGVDGDALGEMVRREDLEWGAAEGAEVGGGVGAASGVEPAAEGRGGSSSRWGVFSWGGGGQSAGAGAGSGTGGEARSAEAEWAAQQAAFKQSAERLAADSAWDGGEWSSSASARASQFRSAAAAGAALDASLQRPLSLTFFSAPKPQPEELTPGSLQQQAILSWLRLESPTVAVSVVLFGDPSDAVLTSFAAQFPEGRVWVEQVDGNFMGTPMFQSMVARGLVEGPGLGRRFDDGRGAGARGGGRAGRGESGMGAGGGGGDGGVMSVSVLINADIILLKDFPLALRKAAARFPYFLLTAMRWDVSSNPFTFHKPSSASSSSVSTSRTEDGAEEGERGERGAEDEDGGDAGWVPTLTRADGRKVSDAEVVAWAREEGVLHTYGGLDLWAWNNPPLQIGLTSKPIPPFTFGRGRYDNWLLSEAVSSGVRPVIDASDALTSIHVNHSYHHMQRGDQSLVPEKAGNFWSLNKRSSWEVFANIHLSHVHGSWSSQEGMAWHAPWKLMRCDEPASAHLCLLRRVKPGSCRCESSPFVHRTQSEPKLQGRNIICGVYNTEGKPDLPVMMPLNTAAPVVGLPHLLEQLLPQVADSSGTVTMLAATFDSKEVVADFVCRAARLSTRNIVVAALDAAAYRYLFLQGIAVYYQGTNLDGYFLPPEQTDSGKGTGGVGSGGGMWKVLLGRVGAGKGAAGAAGAAGGGAGAAQGERVVEGTRECFHGSPCFSRFLLAKVTAIASALHLGFNVLWLDTVFVGWLASPYPYLHALPANHSLLFNPPPPPPPSFPSSSSSLPRRHLLTTTAVTAGSGMTGAAASARPGKARAALGSADWHGRPGGIVFARALPLVLELFEDMVALLSPPPSSSSSSSSAPPTSPASHSFAELLCGPAADSWTPNDAAAAAAAAGGGPSSSPSFVCKRNAGAQPISVGFFDPSGFLQPSPACSPPPAAAAAATTDGDTESPGATAAAAVGGMPDNIPQGTWIVPLVCPEQQPTPQQQQQQKLGEGGSGAVTMAAIKARIDALRLTSYDPRSRVCARAWTGPFLQAMATGKNLGKKKKAKMRIPFKFPHPFPFPQSSNMLLRAVLSATAILPACTRSRSAIAASSIQSPSFPVVSAPALGPRSTVPSWIFFALSTEACSAIPTWTATAGTRAMASKAKKKKQPAGGDGGGGSGGGKSATEGTGGVEAALPGFLRVTASGAVSVAIHAKPGSKQAAVMSLTGDAVGVAIDAPAREGEANAALLEFMADVLGVRKRQVSLQIGSKSRGKVVVVEGVSSQEVLFALQKAVKTST
ncbi:unnamed protein product [Closterium sp. NIES-65]|nr:unnamed protein product [Closterium sp. NIES-65]